ncbi:TetR/AcrR family transcriptional regulator [Roseobacter sp. YSTF-M11]|uniref:TetR/AcrR family transcriptional regulator n=1 Tax=Roseobacter insulae TaxID=2859783 RepID=A0A9X1FYQ4_9RHOB|nr:TetR/AcrR family transcriptional regulator [Roseobacter insulae]MBW4709480.1 TetR/AcrR family transcriptional regulator [Roseobacter insulae]
MPWEKTFDLDEATDKAIQVFWKKGYEGTSMADLIDGMQINKGSLYNAFGSKQELFDRALLRYDQKTRATFVADLSQWEDPVAAINAFFERLLDEAQSGPESLGCFIINTAQDLPNQTPEVVNIVRASLSELEEFFETMIARGHDSGRISADVQARPTAQALLSMVVGLRLLSRGAVDPSTLTSIKDSAMRLVTSS